MAEGGKMEMAVVVGHEREPGKRWEEENQELQGATTLFGRDGSRVLSLGFFLLFFVVSKFSPRYVCVGNSYL